MLSSSSHTTGGMFVVSAANVGLDLVRGARPDDDTRDPGLADRELDGRVRQRDVVTPADGEHAGCPFAQCRLGVVALFRRNGVVHQGPLMEHTSRQDADVALDRQRQQPGVGGPVEQCAAAGGDHDIQVSALDEAGEWRGVVHPGP